MKNLVNSLQTINKYCPTSGKVIYYTEREAATAAHYTTISTNIEMTYYRCADCKHFHLTKASSHMRTIITKIGWNIKENMIYKLFNTILLIHHLFSL